MSRLRAPSWGVCFAPRGAKDPVSVTAPSKCQAPGHGCPPATHDVNTQTARHTAGVLSVSKEGEV